MFLIFIGMILIYKIISVAWKSCWGLWRWLGLYNKQIKWVAPGVSWGCPSCHCLRIWEGHTISSEFIVWRYVHCISSRNSCAPNIMYRILWLHISFISLFGTAPSIPWEVNQIVQIQEIQIHQICDSRGQIHCFGEAPPWGDPPSQVWWCWWKLPTTATHYTCTIRSVLSFLSHLRLLLSRRPVHACCLHSPRSCPTYPRPSSCPCSRRQCPTSAGPFSPSLPAPTTRLAALCPCCMSGCAPPWAADPLSLATHVAELHQSAVPNPPRPICSLPLSCRTPASGSQLSSLYGHAMLDVPRPSRPALSLSFSSITPSRALPRPALSPWPRPR
jgi:hypothetical protein